LATALPLTWFVYFLIGQQHRLPASASLHLEEIASLKLSEGPAFRQSSPSGAWLFDKPAVGRGVDVVSLLGTRCSCLIPALSRIIAP
jgi:hypothetical protein